MPSEDEPRRRGAPLKGEVPRERKTVSVDPRVWNAAQVIATERGESMSGVVEDSLREYAKRHGAKN
jgi:hypothetical protein